MSLQIDPASVHLGKTPGGSVDNLYVANYVGAPGATGYCVLPGATGYTPGNPTLIPLLPSCTFNFTDVLGIPPLPPPPSPYAFRGCETLTATTNIITTDATKNTSLSLIASGPYPSASGIEDCTLQLVGVIDINACNDFTAVSNVIYSGAAAGSSLTVTPSSAPHCGFTLGGNISIAACESFTASSNIAYGNALKGSYLTLTTASQPNCGLDISGVLNVNACESFSASAAVSFHGNAVTKSFFNITPTSTPTCGFTLNGDVQIDACTDFSATGGITFSGSAVKSSSVRVSATQQPNCGLVLAGEVVIDACVTFDTQNTLKIYGDAVTEILPLLVIPRSAPDCGFSLSGELRIDACKEINISVIPDIVPSFIKLYKDIPKGGAPQDGTLFSKAQMLLSSIPIVTGGCDTQIAISMASMDLAVPDGCCLEVLPFTPGTITACCWDENTDGPFIYQDPNTDKIYLSGTLPEPCFVCDPNSFLDNTGKRHLPFVNSGIKLNSLDVNYLKGSECCTSRTSNNINLCNGSIVFNDPVTVTQLSAISSNITMTAGTGTTTKITSGDILLAESGSSAELESKSLTLDNLTLANTFLYATSQSLTYNDAGGNSLETTASHLNIKSGNGYSSVSYYGLVASNDYTGANASVTTAALAITDGWSGNALLESGQLTINDSYTGAQLYASPDSFTLGSKASTAAVYIGANINAGTSYVKATDITGTQSVYSPYVQGDEVYANTTLYVGGYKLSFIDITVCGTSGTQYTTKVLSTGLTLK